ncbi:hypothetical protein AVEN_193627-1, partial [Araneus ventricosus]
TAHKRPPPEEHAWGVANLDTGRKIDNIMPSVSLRPANWIREDVIVFSQHGPLPQKVSPV